MRSTNKDMVDSLSFWGIPRIYRYAVRVFAISWDEISEKKKAKIEKKTDQIARKLIKNQKHRKPGIKTKALFYGMRFFQKIGLNDADVIYWKKNGWLARKRPWK